MLECRFHLQTELSIKPSTNSAQLLSNTRATLINQPWSWDWDEGTERERERTTVGNTPPRLATHHEVEKLTLTLLLRMDIRTKPGISPTTKLAISSDAEATVADKQIH